mmetsp:Transcript_7762/g.17784  ORF Transcript_7762/g.17784 Transcript_7762/m.17784 type:complete len:283 (+) Transcript_7762:1-849(+)
MLGPLIEGAMLQRMKAGREHFTYVALGGLGLVALVTNSISLPETLSVEKRKPFDIGTAVASANPGGFLKLYTQGTPALRKLVTIISLQTMIDGKNMSDLSQIWMREHLKLSVEGIRNFIVSFGFLSMLAGAKITPTLLKTFSVWGYTTLTNLTNTAAFSLRAIEEKAIIWYGAMPLMLPGVNGASSAALGGVLNEHLVASGFGVGESSAWLNNLRVIVGVAATVLYGYFYAFCRKRGIWPGHTYTLAAFVGAFIPQAILMLTVKHSELHPQTAKAKSAGSKA